MNEEMLNQTKQEEEMKNQKISQELQELFTTSVDLPEEQKKERQFEMKKILLETEKIMAQQREDGEGKAGKTIAETFADNKIEKTVIDKYLYLIPKQAEGSTMLNVTDLHGDPAALKVAIEKFLSDDKTHLASLGDVTNIGKEQIQTIEILLKLHNEHPERVHLLRGNCEVDVFPTEGGGNQIYKSQGMSGWRKNVPRLQRVMRNFPLGIVTETKAALVHGSLPRPIRKAGTNGEEFNYKNLEEINELSDYTGEKETLLSGREVRRMIWGDYDTSEEKGHSGKRSYISGNETLGGQLDAIGANILIRGHQRGLLKPHGGGVVLGPDKNVGTFHSARMEDNRMAVISLDKEVTELSEEMFEKV
jgi:predicted phosphodiesterase